jgi:hypothetical protein
MQLNVRKIDERIQKLQEIRRIAADPELVAMLLEFIASDDERAESAPAKAQAAPLPKADDMELLNQIMKGVTPPGNSAASVKRA